MLVVFLASCLPAKTQQVACPNGEHRLKIDVHQLSIDYSGSELVGTMGKLAWTGIKVDVKSTTLQVANAATQQWSEYLKSFAVAWNACIISQQEYAEALSRLYPQLQGDAKALEPFQKKIDVEKQIDQQQLAIILDRYTKRLQRFAELSRASEVFDTMARIASEMRMVREDFESIRKSQDQQLQDIQEQVTQISRQMQLLNGRRSLNESADLTVAATPEIPTFVTARPESPTVTACGDNSEFAARLGFSRDQKAFQLSKIPTLEYQDKARKTRVAVIANTDLLPSCTSPENRDAQIGPFEDFSAKLISLIAVIAPNAEIIPIKAFADDQITDSKLFDAFERASFEGARIILAPFSINEASSLQRNVWERVIRRARSQGIFVIAPAGNYGTDDRSFPAGVKGMFSVASVNDSGQLSRFSSF